MSGIAGIISFDGAPVESGLVEKMTAAMPYRGPDGINHWVRGSVALGQCMLCTTPESLEETQPLTNEDQSLVLVMDGRVDNWEELRRELLGRGAALRTRADAELVLRAYEIWGRDCVQHIDGDFAFVIWDARRQEAFCARDRFGNKPFYYHWSGKTLAFASELRPILDLPWVPEITNEGMLAEFLAAEWYSRDETLWSGILRLVAAHRMIVGRRGLQIDQYWQPDLWAVPAYKKDEDYFEHYRELLTDSVRRLSRSHRALAVEVSGGLDSSAVFCLAEHLRRAERLPAPGIHGYTFSFTEDNAANELVYARAVGAYMGIPIQEIPPFTPPLSWYAERAGVHRDFPGYPNGLMCVGLMKHAASQGCRVMLTGQGGDAWAQGSRVYYAEELAQWHWSVLWECFRADASTCGARQALAWFVRYGCFPLAPSAPREILRGLVQLLRTASPRDSRWLSQRMQQVIATRRRTRARPWAVPRRRNVGQQGLLQNLYDTLTVQVMETFDREGAHAGIEIRHPFYTRAFVQFAFSTPERLRLRGDRTKVIHIQAMQGLMPPAVLERKTKAEFSVVLHMHLDRMKTLLTEVLPQARAGWLDPAGMARLYQSYRNTPQDGWQQWALWGIFGSDRAVKRP